MEMDSDLEIHQTKKQNRVRSLSWGAFGGIVALLISLVLSGAYVICELHPMDALRCDIWRLLPFNVAVGVMWGLYVSRLDLRKARAFSLIQAFTCAIVLMAGCYWFEMARFVVGYPQKEALIVEFKDAVLTENTVEVKRILDMGLDPEVGSREGDMETMIDWAVAHHREKSVRLMIEYGGKPRGWR